MTDATTEQTATRGSAIPVVILVVITLVCLMPFVGKPFHMDDSLFVWTAKHIQSHPLDPYGFEVNWYAYEQPMWMITMNPPLACYYLALAGTLGWSEVVLHVAFLLPALGVVLGTYCLARRFCRWPVVAVLVGLLTPVFLVSSTSVMCDTMMLAFWVWAVYLWIVGLEEDRPAWLAVSAVLVAACALTKYYGISLIPLLGLYSLASKRRFGAWAFFFLIPVGALAGFYWWTKALYGRGLVLDAASYTAATRQVHGAAISWKLLVALSFTGGCMATMLFYAPLLWSRKTLWCGLVFVAIVLAVGPLVPNIGEFPMHDAGGVKLALLVQLAVMTAGGIAAIALAVMDLRKHRDAGSLLLFAWVVGTFVFAGFMNWTVNGRSILPMVPAVGILMVRRMELHGGPTNPRRMVWPLIPAALVALLVAWADYGLADTNRRAARVIHEGYDRGPGDIWFEGHWGFQYYMEQQGAQSLDVLTSTLDSRDVVVIAANNCNVYPMPTGISRHLKTINLPSPPGLSTMSRSVGGGFYSDTWGPLPFGAGRVGPERYFIIGILGTHTGPFDSERQVKLGMKAAEQGDARKAIRHFKEAVSMEPDLADAHMALGVAYAQAGRVSEALPEFVKAVQLDPSYPEAHYNLANAYFQAGRADAAISELRKTLELQPDMVEARNNLAGALVMQHRYAEAASEVCILQEHGAPVRPDILRALSKPMPKAR